MNFFRFIARYVRWYHVVGFMAALTAVLGVSWWLRERERGNSFRWADETDLVEPEL